LAATADDERPAAAIRAAINRAPVATVRKTRNIVSDVDNFAAATETPPPMATTTKRVIINSPSTENVFADDADATAGCGRP